MPSPLRSATAGEPGPLSPSVIRRCWPWRSSTCLRPTNTAPAGEVIIAFAAALGPAGLDELEHMARELLDHGSAGKHRYLAIALENIADARGDVDGYIAAKRLGGSETAAVKEIAERLVAAGRLEEALHCVERPDAPGLERGDIARLKVDILDRLGRIEDAQAVRWSIFAASLSSDILAEYLGRLPEVAAGEARQRAITAARGHPDVDRALPLLADLAPDIAAELVHRRLGEIRVRPTSRCGLSATVWRKLTR